MKITGANGYRPTKEQIELVEQKFEQLKELLKEPVGFWAKIGKEDFFFNLKTGIIKFKVYEEGKNIEQNINNAFSSLENYLKSRWNKIKDEEKE